MKTIKKASLILFIILGILGIAALFMGGFAILFTIAFGILFIYYLSIYLILNAYQKQDSKPFKYIVYFLFILPIVFGLYDIEGLFNFLLQGIKLDMR